MTVSTLADLLRNSPQTRRVYFSFHYGNDKHRADVVKGLWDLPNQREGILRVHDGSLEELAKKRTALAVKRAINGGMQGTSVCCVLVGDETWRRRWCRYEAFNGLYNRKGLLAVHVKSIQANPFAPAATILGSMNGVNPFDYWGYIRPDGHQKLYPVFWDGQAWHRCPLCESVALSPFYWSSYIEGIVYRLSNYYPIYDWANDGAANLPTWVHAVAIQEGR